MSNNSSLEPLENICTQINTLQSELDTLDKDLIFFEDITSKIRTINAPFPGKITHDLNTFYSGLQEVDSMIKELDRITLEKLDAILTGASQAIGKLIAPIPAIIKDISSISVLYPKVQSTLSDLLNPSRGLKTAINKLNAKLYSWSNTMPQDAGDNVGTGLLNAVMSEMKRAIADNIALKNKYDTEIQSIEDQIKKMADGLNSPVSALAADSGSLAKQIEDVNTYLDQYYRTLASVSSLSEKADRVVSLLDKFKPNVDLVYGIMQPLGWFIELIETKTCPKAEQMNFDTGVKENRLTHYAHNELLSESKFQVFEHFIYSFLASNHIGQKIGDVIENFLPIDDLKEASDLLKRDLQELNNNNSVINLLDTFTKIAKEISNVETELNILSTDARRATGTITFKRAHPGSETTLVKGTKVQSKEGGILFLTTADAQFNSGSFTSDAVTAIAQSVGTAGNVTANAVTVFLNTPVKQPDKTYKSQPNPVYDNAFRVIASSVFSGGTDFSISQIQGEANELANKMLPALSRLMNFKNNRFR